MNAETLSRFRELIGESFSRFGPESLLGLAVVALLLADLVGRPTWRRATWIAGGALLAVLGWLIVDAPDGSRPLFGFVEEGVHRGMLVEDGFAWVFKLIILGSALLVLPMARSHRDLEDRPLGEFLALLLGATLGMFLMVSSTNLLMAYIAIEFASMGSYLLTAYVKRDRLGSEAGLKYVLYGSVASGVMIFGMSLLYGLTGSLWIGDLGLAVVSGELDPRVLMVCAVLLFGGFAYKMAAFPMHFWCPDVYQGASTPVTAFLSVASKAAGFGLFVRFLMAFGEGFTVRLEGIGGLSFGWFELVAITSAASMTIGNLAALWQENVKRMLAYSSVAHAGYLLMGVCALRPGADSGASLQPLIFYFIAYFAMNLGAFFLVNIVAHRRGSEELAAFAGMGRRAPLLALFLALFLVSLIGIPPTGGFTGKWLLLVAILESERNLVWLAVVAGLNTAISVYYYSKLLKVMYLEQGDDGEPLRWSPFSAALTGGLAVVVLVLGVFFSSVADWAAGFGL